MPRRKTTRTKTLSRDSKGRYLRNIGKVRNPKTGKISQRKFYLGHDEDAALHSAARLAALWKCVEKRFKRIRTQQLVLSSLGQSQAEYEMVGNVIRPKRIPTEPLWCPISLRIADAIRSGQPIAPGPLEP